MRRIHDSYMTIFTLSLSDFKFILFFIAKTVIIVKKVNDNSPLANYISGGDILIAINNVSYMNPTLKQFESFSDQLKTIKDSMFIQFFRLNKNGNVVYDPNAVCSF